MSDGETLWDGERFVFDDRVALDDQLEVGSYQMCYACRMPLKTDLKDDKYEKELAAITVMIKHLNNEKRGFISASKLK